MKRQKELKCEVCKKTLPNKDMFTKNGCIWCDAELALAKIISREK